MKPTLDWQIATITNIKKETSRAASFTLALPHWTPHKAGQHYDLRLTADMLTGMLGRASYVGYSLGGRLCLQAALLCALGFTALGVLAAPVQAQEPFYKGKRITVLINFAAGGPTDIEGRVFAKYLARHIDGAPNVIVQNMDGAGGVVGATYLGEVAPKDGTYVGYLSGTSWIYVSEPERWRVDFKSYEFVGYHPGTTVHFTRMESCGGPRLIFWVWSRLPHPLMPRCACRKTHR